MNDSRSAVMGDKCPEPWIVYPEDEFEKSLHSLISDTLRNDPRGFVVPKFGLDFAVFTPDPAGYRVIFVEVKSYGGQRQGGIGFGSAKGEGPQVDLLLFNADRLQILDRFVG